MSDTFPLLGKRDRNDAGSALSVPAATEATASVKSAIFNLTNTIVGAGMLALPFAFKSTGVIVGPVLLVITYALMLHSCWLLLSCSKHISIGGVEPSFRQVAVSAFGRVGVLLAQGGLFIATFGAMTGYLVILGDMISPLVGHWMGGTVAARCSVFADRRFIITLSLWIVCPLSMLRVIDSFRFTSYLAGLSIMYLVVIVVIRSGQRLDKGASDELSFAEFSTTLFRAIPIITLAFTCQMNLFPIVNGLENPTKQRLRIVLAGSFTVCLVIYVLVGTFGYLTFYSAVSGNVLLNYEVDDPFVIVGRLALALVILFSFPLMAHPCLNSVDEVLFPARPFSYVRRFFEATVVIGVAYTIAMLVEDVSLILGIAGSTGSILISFILPALFFLKLSPAPVLSVKKVLAALLALLGGVFLVVSTVVTLLDAAKSTDDGISSLCNKQ